ncbi:hypothetical protein ABI_14910 [Asticcacaulis biprosthecium C19]|uniref:Uncharacterized protein n=1 Tax=Asticcacaulis biprosthecium C19 TaxID=715226 RepID=F4QIY9_9CAUL|nr:hypothetical protein [Asticcacaulis biprosthecium]EGF93052.1 hypothetical protein ABI_14910 [Asticcacaulis biprosthecium C19]
MKAIYFTAGLLALSTGAAHADSLANAAKASNDSAVATGELAESGVKLVAGATAYPLMAGGLSLALPGAALGFSGYDNDNGSAMSAGIVAASPGLVLLFSGIELKKFSDEPLEISPETMSAKPVKTIQPVQAGKAAVGS